MNKHSFLEQHIDSIVHSDNMEFMQQLPDACIDMIFADPPYNMRTNNITPDFRRPGKIYKGVVEDWDKIGSYYEYKCYCKRWIKEFKRILKPNGTAWIMGTQHGIYTIGSLVLENGFFIINDAIWNKTDSVPSLYPRKLCPRHETLLWITHEGNTKYTFNYHTLKELRLETSNDPSLLDNKKQLGTVWTLGICKGYERIRLKNHERLHPTQKPKALMSLVLTVSSRPGDLILDPFSGTGTTAVVAKEMGRRFIGVEKEKKYIKPSIDRIKAVHPSLTSIERCEFDTEEKKKIRRTTLFNTKSPS